MHATLRRQIFLAGFAAAMTPRALNADVGAPVPSDGDVTPFVNFSELKNTLVSKISAANSRVWLSTDYLTDGDVVAALHLAKYRKVDVQVLLGRQKATAYMSRLGFLKNEDIPAWIKPRNFMPGVQSAILSDNQLYFVDGDLDFMTTRGNFVLRTATPAQAQEYGAAFQAAVAEGLEIEPTPPPAVGRPGRYPSRSLSPKAQPQKAAAPKAVAPTARTPQQGGRINSDGSYRYGRNKQSRPEGIPNKLPKTLKWKEMEKIRNSENGPDGG
jgi:hypothetical protein